MKEKGGMRTGSKRREEGRGKREGVGEKNVSDKYGKGGKKGTEI